VAARRIEAGERFRLEEGLAERAAFGVLEGGSDLGGLRREGDGRSRRRPFGAGESGEGRREAARNGCADRGAARALPELRGGGPKWDHPGRRGPARGTGSARR
jgi:hypothetical protein